MNSPKWLIAALAVLSWGQAHSTINVLACEPEWAALVTEIAGAEAKVYTATTALQDVHRIQARPSLIAAARRADLLVCTGAELEIGWLPILVRESGNSKIQPGAPGNFEAAAHVTLIDPPSRIDRSEGDVHPQGNPHLHTDPRNIARVAVALTERLAQLDAANAAMFRQRQRAFSERWQGAIAQWEKKGAALKGVKVIEHHRAFTYLFLWLGVEAVAYIEPKPGLEPTAAHLAELLKLQKANPAKMIIRTSYNDPRASDWLAERARVPAVVLPFSVGGSDAAKNLYAWFDDLLDRLLKEAK